MHGRFSSLTPFVLVALVTATVVSGVSCNDATPTAIPTTPAVAAENQALEEGTVQASRVSRVLVCHKGSDLELPEPAVEAHLAHGDTRGSCPAPVCPCFAATDILNAASPCGARVTATCSVGDPYYLFLACDPGGTVPPSVLGIYLVQTSGGGYCRREDIDGSVEQAGLTGTEHQACLAAINQSGYCR